MKRTKKAIKTEIWAINNTLQQYGKVLLFYKDKPEEYKLALVKFVEMTEKREDLRLEYHRLFNRSVLTLSIPEREKYHEKNMKYLEENGIMDLWKTRNIQ